MSISNLGALIVTHPEDAKEQILAAVLRAKGDRKKAAELLATTHRSFYRFVEKLRLWDEIDKLISENGFPQIPGPPRSAEKIKSAIVLMKGDLTRAARVLEVRPGALEGRIQELNLWDELNATLKASKLKPLERPRQPRA
jgi:hypothetical protein